MLEFVKDNSTITKAIDVVVLANYKLLKVETLKFPCNAEALLRAICENESTYGINNHPRFEPGYYIGSHIYHACVELQEAIAKYGKDAACSYSSWQIMYETAREFGYTGRPMDLHNDTIAIKYVVMMINRRIFHRGPMTLEDIFDAYNSGSFRDRYHPTKYINEGMTHYHFYLNSPIKVNHA